MRLSTIKLAGFKSFVDPTSVHFPGKRVAIVGPNGCGKSNIIDAVRWVMGESQAKQLRGESMTDVIFNGAQLRKPVGQASIELIFDNSDQSLIGEYGQYNQISVKRVVTRDGQSNYFLNGTRCRRKDVTDLFLGTGLGPRSYAIIEQGTISRIIEARPEDLRAYLEEVSGIAKYKERRKETEQRMLATKENLERVNDVRQEIEKQLSHLEKQAKAAEKYKLLKQEERQTKAYFQALQWQDIHSQFEKKQLVSSELQMQYDQQHQLYLDTSAELFKQREILQQKNHGFQSQQEQFYQLNSKVEREEQSLRYQKERAQQAEQELYRTRQNFQQTETQLLHDQHQLKQLDEKYNDEKPEVERLQRSLLTTQDALKNQEQEWNQIQSKWDQLQQEHAKRLSSAEVERTQIHHLELRFQENRGKLTKLQEEQKQWSTEITNDAVQQAQQQLQKLQEEQQQFETQRKAWQNEIHQQKTQVIQQQRDIQQHHLELQKLQGRLASLESQQQNTLGSSSSQFKEWLKQNNLENSERLGRRLTVEKGFEDLVEKILGAWLQAVVCEGKQVHEIPSLERLNQEAIHLISETNPNQVIHSTFPSLAEKIQGPLAIRQYLSSIIPIESLEKAWEILEQLPAHCSVVTPQGFWIGHGWLKTLTKTTTQGTFEREREIREIQEQIETRKNQILLLEEQLKLFQDRLKDQEKAFDEQSTQVAELQQKIAEAKARVNIEQSEWQRKQKQREQIEKDILSLEQLLVQQEQDINQHRIAWQAQLQELEKDESIRTNLQQNRNELQVKVQQSRQQANELQQNYHQASLSLQKQEQELRHLRQQIDRATGQKQHLEKRIEQLQQAHQDHLQPQEQLQQTIVSMKEQKDLLEKDLTEQKNTVNELEKSVKTLSETQLQLEQEGERLRQNLEKSRLDAQGLEVRQKSIEEQLQETEYKLEELVNTLQPEWTLASLEAQLETLKSRIERLGAINLAAIEEYAEVSQRKVYLDQQIADLDQALNTLTDAIRKIDRETRERFKETYDQVNQYFMELFPSIFGGGEAKLELVGEDLLETGVQVMARPPGKRNSSINLLSGGEKALTALALVFSLFRLNPAPFCLLDEVDAPLDDANIGRFCNLVRKMSENVQFIFISHNKLAIEMAEQLIGVTMREPGVSRLVAVDIHEAMAMAGE